MTALAFDDEEALLVGTATGRLLRLSLDARTLPAPVASEPGMILAVACHEGLVAWGGAAGGVTVQRQGGAPLGLPVPGAPGVPAPGVVWLSFTDDASVWAAVDDGTARRLELSTGRELDRLDLRGLDDAPLRVLPLSTGRVVLLTERGALLGFRREGC